MRRRIAIVVAASLMLAVAAGTAVSRPRFRRSTPKQSAADITVPTDGTLTITQPNTGANHLVFTAASDNIGVVSYTIRYSTSGTPATSCTDGSTLYSGALAAVDHSSLTGGTAVYYRVCALDAAGNTSVGVTGSGTPWTNVCYVTLDGADDYVDAADQAALDPSAKFSACISFNAASTAGGKILLGKWDSAHSQSQWLADVDGGGNGFKLTLCTSAASCTSSCSSRSNSWALSEWHTACFVYDGTQSTNNDRCKIVEDGADVTLSWTGTYPTTLADSTAKFTVGARTDGENTRDLAGKVDEVLYSATTAWDDATLYDMAVKRSGIKPAPTGTTLQWRMGDLVGCSGTTVTDPISGITGTLRGNAVFASTSPITKDVPSTASCTALNSTRQCFVIAGQSNASGRGTGTAYTTTHGSQIWLYKTSGSWLQNPSDPIDDHTGETYVAIDDSGTGNSFGPKLADYLAGLYPNHEIGLIPVAKGGTSVLEHLPGIVGTAFIYGAELARATAAAASCELAGWIYYQGEDDAQNIHEATQWDERFMLYRQRIRQDLNLPRLPFIVVRLAPTGPGGSFTNWTDVRASQLLVGDQDTIIVSAPDGPYVSGTPVHIETAAQNVLGPIIADAWVTTCQGASVAP